MKNILLLSYGMLKQDGPLENLIKICKLLGDTYLVSFASYDDNKEFPYTININKKSDRNNPVSLTKYIVKSIKCARLIKKEFILISDDFISVVSALIVRLIFKPAFYVHYARELYFGTKMPKWGKLFVRLEKHACKIADAVICCNSERAIIMKDEYKLKSLPIVLENIRKLDGVYDKAKLDEKYSSILKDGLRLIETGGCEIERGTINLVKAVSKIPNCTLYIIGKGHADDYRKVTNCLEREDINNVVVLERVPLVELRYLIDQCHIGVVIYHKKDLNNIYCASGKVYEYLFEGLPLLTTENASLMSICNQYHVGISDDGFVDGINEIAAHIDKYKMAVEEYRNNFAVDKYLSEFAKKLSKELHK